MLKVHIVMWTYWDGVQLCIVGISEKINSLFLFSTIQKPIRKFENEPHVSGTLYKQLHLPQVVYHPAGLHTHYCSMKYVRANY